jgi:hypothetical protein
MDEREMEWQLRQYYEKGVRSLFIHGRFGLTVPYVSDAWFEKVKVAVALAKRIGIDAWVYDEMNWPSGTAERKVPTHYPHLTQKYLELVALNVDGPLFTFLEATDNRYVNTGDSYPVAAFGCTEEEFQTQITNPIDLTLNLSFERVIPWEAPPGKWRLLYFLQKEVPYYIDTLNPESTQRFIELTHDKYKQAVGAEFGGVVPGFYTDEPAMHYYHVGIDNYVIPWTTQMFKIFRQKRGYDLHPLLPALYLNMGPRTAQIRYDFWRTLTEQYAETYYGRIRTWCEEHGVLFTGHLLFEEWLRMHARCEGNLFKYLKQFHIVGVDHLYPKVGTAQEPAEHVSLKVASSAAHHFGSTRLLCESMGGSYWDCTLERMKWIANWEYVLGVNLFNNHGYHYSIEGERKRDWPPSQFYHHTWWKHYERFTTYMSRTSHLLSGGRHVAKVLILYPINSIWANYVPQQRTPEGNATEFDFNYLTDTLLRLHYDFDYVDEDVLAEATIENGTIRIRDEAYSVVILPPVTHIKRSTFDVLEKFVLQGGSLAGDALLPVEFFENGSESASSKIRSLFGVDPRRALAEFQKAGSLRVTTMKRKKGKGNTFFLSGKGLHHGTARKQLQAVLASCANPDVTISEEDVFYLHRVREDLDIYFFVNTSLEAKSGVAVSFEQQGIPEEWNPNTGETRPVHVYGRERGRLALTLDFPPAEARVIVLRKGSVTPHVASTNLRILSFDGKTLIGAAAGNDTRVRAEIMPGRKRLSAPARKALRPVKLPAKWQVSLEGDNAFLVDRLWMLAAEPPAGVDVADPGYDHRGWLPVKPGAWEMQLPQERDEVSYPVVLWYRATVEADLVPGDLRLLIDGFSGTEYTLFVNGQKISDKGKRSTLDAEINEVHVGEYFHPGSNVVAVRLLAGRRTDGILDPLKFVGTFSVQDRDGVLHIAPCPETISVGDITAKGFPFFSGTIVYSADVSVPAPYAGGRIVLEAECGDDVLEVCVNGAEAGVLPWHPYRIDITEHLRVQGNQISLKVTNTLINMLEGVRRPSGLRTVPRLLHEHVYSLQATKGR